jgi:NAD+ kinase
MTMKKHRIAFFARDDNKKAKHWAAEIRSRIEAKNVHAVFTNVQPSIVIALGGDGTILEAARTHRTHKPIILGLNLGHVGFLASVRSPKSFMSAIDRLCVGDFAVAKRMMLTARVVRAKHIMHEIDCLNEVTVQGLMGAVKLTISVDGHPLQYIHGTGAIVSTPTGSTAYNLSAHGPIVSPDINCMIVTELLDHNIPTPSIIIKKNKMIRIDITEVRKRGLLAITRTGMPVDAVLTADDMDPIPIAKGDVLEVTLSKHVINFAEFEENYFLKSLQKKFAFR